ncbi:hypothetical protein [Fischerella sp. PCC 9605]|uniref:hypothetical protein n=1 Tax=Fischerella sp. PCC 9605 TaxID=1173024 RepID=UPI00047D826B|nr:hypothetical protein [Fischerella sp. PCC 9605]
MISEIKLGLCNPPLPVYLYVNQGELNGESYVWYRYDTNQDKKIPVPQRGITGYLTELRLTAKEFKGKDNRKLDIVVSADEVYVIRTGIETNFAKTFLLAASIVQDFSKPLIIAAISGEENAVFCQLYDAVSKVRIRREWNKDADWGTIINDIQSRLSCCVESDIVPTVKQPTTIAQTTVVPSSEVEFNQDLRVKQIRTLLNYPVELVKEWLQFHSVSRPSQLDVSKVDELVKTMCLAWADSVCDHPNYAASLYQQYVIGARATGVDETAAIRAWMQQCNSKFKIQNSKFQK